MACIFGLFMTWGIGANDVANAMATSVGSKALTFKTAILIAAVFEFTGAFLAGGHVTNTIRKGIIDPGAIVDQPEVLVWGMLASLLAAGIWLMIASYKGWPVSTTHSIIGAIVGFAVAGIGVDAVNWSKIGAIVASWVISPVFGGAISFTLIVSVQKLILNTEKPFENAVKYAPFYLFLLGFTLSMVTIFKGLKHLNLHLSFGESIGASLLFSAILVILGKRLIKRVKKDDIDEFKSIERIFAAMMIFTACGMAFAHGSNDVANGVGPVAAVVSIVMSGGEVLQESEMPLWVLAGGGIGIVVGLATYGFRVIQTIGTKITELVPSRGFASELAAAATVVIASRTGMPVSTTHIVVGCVMGVGFARGIGALNLRVIGGIFMSWIITLPVGALLSIMFFFMFKGIFS